MKEVNRSRKAITKQFGQAEPDEEARRVSISSSDLTAPDAHVAFHLKESFRRANLKESNGKAQVRREDRGTAYAISKAGTAITSHASKSKTSSTAARGGPSNRPLAKSASLLTRVPGKKGGFDS